MKKALKDDGPNSALPNGFPEKVEYPMCWKGNEIAPSEYLHPISEIEVEEIEQALNSFKGANVGISHHLRELILILFSPRAS